MSEKNRENPSETKRPRALDELSDMEVALRWKHELENPCAPPGQQELHVGDAYLREAETDIARMKSQADDSQNPFAISILEQAIADYKKRNVGRIERLGELKAVYQKQKDLLGKQESDSISDDDEGNKSDF